MKKIQPLDKLILENFKTTHHFKMNSNIKEIHPIEISQIKKKIQQYLLNEKSTGDTG